jgi:hypothetical protein
VVRFSVAAFVLAATALVVACAGRVRGPSTAPLTVKEIVDRSKPAIVRIESEFDIPGPDGKNLKGVGTGFIVKSTGRIITNLHVIVDAERQTGPALEVSVTLLDGSKHKLARVVDIDPKRDLALIEIDARRELPTLQMGDSDKISTGERVVAIGNPLGFLDYTVSEGLISGVRVWTDELTMIQFSAPISQGSSGGPLFNNRGEVIGVATLIAQEGQNLNFGIPSNYLRPLLSHGGGGKTLAELRAAMQPVDPPVSPIKREVPEHALTITTGCEVDGVAKVYREIADAISEGVPRYNARDHKGCFLIYEGAALRVEREGWCKPLGAALVDGVNRAKTKTSFNEKAWAMRDAFDGVLLVIRKKIALGELPPGPFKDE